jgi:hypothetical protein
VSIKDALELLLAALGIGGVLFATARYFGRLDTTVVHLTQAVNALNNTVETFRRETDERLDDHERRLSHVEGRLQGRRAADVGLE